jgi:hypothetical protein
LLEEVGRQPTDPIYLQVLSSAYACRAGFDEISFIASDIPLISSSALGLMKSLTRFSDSAESAADSPNYRDTREAINVLLGTSGAAEPSQLSRNSAFGARKSGDIGIQILLLSISQFGKFLHFYGNVDSDGDKGEGAANADEQGAVASTCFLKYDDSRAVTFLQAGPPYQGGVCNNLVLDQGHPDLTLAGAQTNRRLCEGLMLLTNIIDTINNIDLPSNSSLSALSNISDDITAFKTTATALDPQLATLLNTTSQSRCETLLETPAEKNNMQYIYALIFETGLK